MTDHAALIAELEAATAEMVEEHMSSRELDGTIAIAMGWKRVGKGWAHWTNPEGETEPACAVLHQLPRC